MMPYDVGPIRPPSEARSLLIRLTRNCPWNRCEFCPVYKGQRFEKKSVAEIQEDILRAAQFYGGRIPHVRTAFLQDADSLILKTDELVTILSFLKQAFPNLERITSYGRGRTLARKSVEEWRAIQAAGLSRVHLGLETGCDALLHYVQKGATAQEMIEGGRRVVEAGLSLSVYVILGLGGQAMWREHAVETARVINQIGPDFIRFRTLCVREGTPLREKLERGEFILLPDEEIVREERLLLERLEGIHSQVVSDHISNLLEEVMGRLPEDKEPMLSVLDRFLALSAEEQQIFMVGRRGQVFRCLYDLQDRELRARIERAIQRIEEERPGGLRETLQEWMERMI
ncbi:MAG: radical SAM protein [Candidatus Tectomicrobia bacterium]|uniref:Radical SAM protein n=1 Tax=Tectimicrobiota bacterium TaxID=2528274 RepID=A0A932CQU0_UNCTE|nr:radical SAM protein [Candidatus Tectomicrobia bacterium]